MRKSALFMALGSVALGATTLVPAAFAHDETYASAEQSRWQGTVEAVNHDSLTLKTSDGSSVKVEMGKQTKYEKQGKPGSLADLRPGMPVSVQGKMRHGSLHATAIRYGSGPSDHQPT